MKYLILLLMVLVIDCSMKSSPNEAMSVPPPPVVVGNKPDPNEEIGYGDIDPNEIESSDPIKGLDLKGGGVDVGNPDVDYLKSQLDSGIIAYNIPEQMKMGKKYRIELRVDDKKSEALTNGLGVNPTVVPIQVSLTMKALLTGNGFSIDTISSTVQLRKFNTPTVWLWDVVPHKSGIHNLKLKIIGILKRAGYSDENYDVVVYEVQRKVELDFWLAFKGFANEQWKTILGFIISSGLLAWIVKLIKGKTKKKKAS